MVGRPLLGIWERKVGSWITQPVRSRPTSMTCKQNGAVMSFLYATQYGLIQRRLNSNQKSFEIFGGLDGPWWEKGCFGTPWVELRRLLSECQSSLSDRRRTHSMPKMKSWRFFEGSSTSAIVRRQREAPGQVMTASPTTTWTGCIFPLLVMHGQWAKIVQPRTGWRHARQQPDFLLLFGMCGDSLSGTTTGVGAAVWIKTTVFALLFRPLLIEEQRWNLEQQISEHFGPKKIRNLSPPKSRFWSVHTCLKAGPLLEAILVIFGRRALIFFVWKLLEKNEKWHHFCAHAPWWSPWRRENVEKGHLAPSNLTFVLIAIDTNGFRRMKEEGLIYKTMPQIS